jgi:hypothetical protein
MVVFALKMWILNRKIWFNSPKGYGITLFRYLSSFASTINPNNSSKSQELEMLN